MVEIENDCGKKIRFSADCHRFVIGTRGYERIDAVEPLFHSDKGFHYYGWLAGEYAIERFLQGFEAEVFT